MAPTDEKAFRELLKGLGEVFGREVTPAVASVYWQALRDLALSTVEAMARSHARTGKFFPKPFELRPAEARQSSGSSDDRAFRSGQTWAVKVLESIKAEEGEARYQDHVRLRWADRVIATAAPSSAEYADALAVAERLRPVVRGY